MQKVILIIFLGIILTGFLAPVFADAEEWEGLVRCGGENQEPCTLCDFFLMLDRAIDFLIAPPGGIVFIIAALILVIGGTMFVVSSGEPEKIATAKKTMTNAILGLIIIFAAWLFINLFYTVIGYKDEWGPWNEIKCSVIDTPIAQNMYE